MRETLSRSSAARSADHLPSRMVAQGETAPRSNFPRSKFARMCGWNNGGEPLLYNQPTDPPSPSLWNAFAAAETDALKADFTTFLRVHFVCRCHARAPLVVVSRSSEFGLEMECPTKNAENCRPSLSVRVMTKRGGAGGRFVCIALICPV